MPALRSGGSARPPRAGRGRTRNDKNRRPPSTVPDHVSRPASKAAETGESNTPASGASDKEAPRDTSPAEPGTGAPDTGQGPSLAVVGGEGGGKGAGGKPARARRQDAGAEANGDDATEGDTGTRGPKADTKAGADPDIRPPKKKRKNKRRANLPARTGDDNLPARRRRPGLPAEEDDEDFDMRPRQSKPVPPPVMTARPRARHRLILLSFLILVALPVAVSAWYLWTRAADRYASEVGFTVRREDSASAVDFLGGLGNMSSSATADTDVLYEFIQSTDLVRAIDAELDLRGHYSAPYDIDPVFAFDPSGTIEDLTDYWRRTIKVSYDPGNGLMELQVLAFDPVMARDIGDMILDESSRVINELSAIAREDAMRYAREELETAKAELKDAREALTAFRSRTRIVDPNADLQGQMGLLTTLQQRLADAMIELDMLRETSTDRDPRLTQVQLRIDTIRRRIEEERAKFSAGGQGAADGQDYATVVAEFERLTVEREFAEESYSAALTAFASARTEAERQSRYLAPFVRPSVAEKSEYPQRLLILGLVTLFVFLTWAVLVLVYYSLRDRQ